MPVPSIKLNKSLNLLNPKGPTGEPRTPRHHSGGCLPVPKWSKGPPMEPQCCFGTHHLGGRLTVPNISKDTTRGGAEHSGTIRVAACPSQNCQRTLWGRPKIVQKPSGWPLARSKTARGLVRMIAHCFKIVLGLVPV